MTEYVAFLRGINVGGHKVIRMQALKEMCKDLGLSSIETYIQSGNIRFKAQGRKPADLAAGLHNAVKDTFGHEVDIWVGTPTELQEVLNANPYFSDPDTKKYYYVLLLAVPSREKVEKLQSISDPVDRFHLSGRVVYIECNSGYNQTKFSNNFIENILGVKATTRNHATMMKMTESV